jgi:hypothetical protein
MNMSNKKDEPLKGGSFLIEEMNPERMYTPEDFTEEHKMIAKTTEERKQENSGCSELMFQKLMEDLDLIKLARR